MTGARPLRLLYADDNALDIERVERLARRLAEPLEVIPVRDGVDAVDLLNSALDGAGVLPDAVLLDLNMPRLSGHDTLTIIRDVNRLRHLYVGVITTSMRTLDRERANGLGADDYLVKALTSERLARMLDTVRRRPGR